LCLNKPVGSGIIVSAPVFGIDVDSDTRAAAVRSMRIVNRDAAAAACASGARGCTDVSGYGLLGACAEVAAQSGVTVEVTASRVPLLPGVTELVASQAVPARADETWRWISRRGLLLDRVGGAATVMLCGPETSGGLLVGLEANQAEEAVSRHGFAIIGQILDGSPAVHVV
jgi:selenide,water dikinase